MQEQFDTVSNIMLQDCTVDLKKKIQHWLPVKKGLEKQCRPRSDCFWKSSLASVNPVCYSYKHYVNSSSDS